jgi:hypothetical protein
VNKEQLIADISPARIEWTNPVGYQLGRKPNGEIVLLGAIRWEQGETSGVEWRELPTVEMPK